MPDLAVAARHQGRVLEAVERALSGERRAGFAVRLELADQGRQHRVVAQLVVVDKILLSQRDPADALHEQGLDGVLHQLRRAVIDEAPRQAPYQPKRPVRGAQQQRPGVRSPARRRRRPPPGDLRPLHIRTDRGYTLSASGSSSASR
jgi:hypothetical protein